MANQRDQVEIELLRKQAAAAGGTATWGSITGTLSSQTDLNNALADKIEADSTDTLTNKTIVDGSNYVEADAVHLKIFNNTGVQLDAGTPVYVTGFNVGQDALEVGKADASSAATMPCIGIIEDDVSNGSTGFVAEIGVVDNLDTSAWSEGDLLYISETAGELTSTKPTGTALVQRAAVVAKSNVAVGSLEVAIDTSTTITGYAATILDDGDAATARTTLGLATVSQAEAEAGTATTERAWTAERVKQAIDALGGGGGGGPGRTRMWVPARPIQWDGVTSAGTWDAEGDAAFRGFPGVLLADANDRSSVTHFDVPDSWLTYDVIPWFVVANSTISAGAWTGQVEVYSIDTAEDLAADLRSTAVHSYGNHTWGGGTARGNIWAMTGGTTVTNYPGLAQWAVMRRQANAGGDTLNGDIILFGYELVMVTGTSSPRPTWNALTFNTGWSDFGAGWDGGEYCITDDGFVELRGLVKKSTAIVHNDVVATLPVGARPLNRTIGQGTYKASGAPSGDYAFIRLDVNTSGDIICISPPYTSTTNFWLNLAGIRFHLD